MVSDWRRDESTVVTVTQSTQTGTSLFRAVVSDGFVILFCFAALSWLVADVASHLLPLVYLQLLGAASLAGAVVLAAVALVFSVWKRRLLTAAMQAGFFLLILFVIEIARMVTIPKADDFYWTGLRDELLKRVPEWSAVVKSSHANNIDIPVPATLSSRGINEILGARSPRGEEVVQLFTGVGFPMGHSGFLVSLNGPLPADSDWRSVWNLRRLESNWYRFSK